MPLKFSVTRDSALMINDRFEGSRSAKMRIVEILAAHREGIDCVLSHTTQQRRRPYRYRVGRMNYENVIKTVSRRRNENFLFSLHRLTALAAFK